MEPQPTTPSEPTSPAKDALLGAGIILAGGAAGLLITWGHPWSNWYYAFILVCVIAALLVPSFGWRSGRRVPSNPPLPQARAIISGAGDFLLSASFVYLYMVLTLGETYQWPMAIGLGLTSGVSTYRAKRGMAFSNKPLFLIWGVFMLGLIVFAVVKLVQKGVIKF